VENGKAMTLETSKGAISQCSVAPASQYASNHNVYTYTDTKHEEYNGTETDE
jgi:hypothetical protein